MKIIKVKCGACDGTGQDSEWEDHDTAWVVTDCKSCKGTGKVDVKIIDKRIHSAKKGIVLPAMC